LNIFISETLLLITTKKTKKGDKMAYYIKNPQNNPIDNLLDSWLKEIVDDKTSLTQRNSNVISTEHFVEIQIETTGLTKENVTIDIQDGVLSVSYDHKDVEQVQYTQQQIFIDSFINKYKLKNNMDQDNISATMLNGLLYIKIPKIKNKITSKIKIT
jgi:HSP20 family protein